VAKRSRARRAAKAVGLRSGFELSVAEQLDKLGVEYTYESETYPWQEKIARAKCGDCGGAAFAPRKYTPDFFLSNGVVIEAKGRFTVQDRKIALAMREQGIEIRYVFQFDNRLSKKSDTRYSDWCDKYDLWWAVKEVPKEWTT
jgi:hypothetical protein